MYPYIQIHINERKCMCEYVYLYTDKCKYIHINTIHIYMCMNMCMYICV